MYKKVIALTVVLMMAISLLAACTTGGTATESKGEATAQATSAATKAEEPPVAAVQNRCPYTGDPVTFNVFAADVGVKEKPEMPVYQVYKKAVGNIEIKWELVPFSDFDTKAKLYFNSGEIPDIIWYRSPDLMKDYSSSGLFLDFNKYTDFTPNWNAATKKNPGLKVYESEKGEQFIIHGVDNDYPEETFMANKTLLDKLGIALPKTLEELEAAMAKVKASDPSVIPFHTFWGTGYYEGIFATSLGARTGMYFDLADKKWKHALITPESKYKELITLMADYYKKGYFNPEFSTMSDDQTAQLMASSKWAFSFTYGGQMNAWYKVDNNAKMPIDIEPLLPLPAKGVKANMWCAYVGDNPYWGYSASSKVKNPELAASWIDTMLSDDVADAFQWGVEGTSYTKDSNGKKHWIPEFLTKGNQAALDLGIWNIMGPRYITKRDDSSILQKASPIEQKLVTMMVKAIKSGEVESPYYRANPKFSDAETEELSAIMTPINTKITENEALFILGKRPLSEWDSYIKEVKAVGNIERAVEIYNNAKQSFDRAQGIDREYITP